MLTKTSIAFGLVYIPVKLSAAARHDDVGFNMLDKNGSRIRYKKVNDDGEEVEHKEIVRGYEYEKGKYVTFTDDELDKIKSERDKQITITQFVSASEIDPVYYEKSYYLSPMGGEKAYSLFVSALKKQKKVGIAKAVPSNKETLVAVRADGDRAILSTLYFPSEILPPPAVNIPAASKEELNLACTLIDSMTKPFSPDEYRDEYREKLMKAIDAKIAGKDVTTPKERKAGNVLNLLDALRASLEGGASAGV
ncbi:Ku protein [Pumilibacter muris]|uniref:non-homologous end joining protein Ku n=1 Tax=Pumilibacter muris TaxID=2941510 RepID=UPI00203BFE45|nr:Ku protein [Pumilibacter muris]